MWHNRLRKSSKAAAFSWVSLWLLLLRQKISSLYVNHDLIRQICSSLVIQRDILIFSVFFGHGLNNNKFIHYYCVWLRYFIRSLHSSKRSCSERIYFYHVFQARQNSDKDEGTSLRYGIHREKWFQLSHSDKRSSRIRSQSSIAWFHCWWRGSSCRYVLSVKSDGWQRGIIGKFPELFFLLGDLRNTSMNLMWIKSCLISPNVYRFPRYLICKPRLSFFIRTYWMPHNLEQSCAIFCHPILFTL